MRGSHIALVGVLTVAGYFPFCGSQSTSPVTQSSSWIRVTIPNDLAFVENGAYYLVGILNLKQVFQTPTIYEKLIVAYQHIPGSVVQNVTKALPPRYFMVVEVTQGAEPFVLMLSGYVDDLQNWNPVLPTHIKSFRIDPTTGEAPSWGFAEDLWFLADANDPAVVSAYADAKVIMERSYFPVRYQEEYVAERVVQYEVLYDEVKDLPGALLRRKEGGVPDQARQREEEEMRKQEEEIGVKLAEFAAEKKTILEELVHGGGRENWRETTRLKDVNREIARLQSQLHEIDQRRDMAGRKARETENPREEAPKRQHTREDVRRAMEREGRGRANNGAQVRANRPGVHVMMVMDFIPARLVNELDREVVLAARLRRQLLVYHQDYTAGGAWQLLGNLPFEWSEHAATPEVLLGTVIS